MANALCDVSIIENQHVYISGDEYGPHVMPAASRQQNARGRAAARQHHRQLSRPVNMDSSSDSKRLCCQTVQCMFCVAPGMRIGIKTIVVLIWTFFIALTSSLITRYVALGDNMWSLYSGDVYHIKSGIDTFFCTSYTITQLSPYYTDDGYIQVFLYETPPLRDPDYQVEEYAVKLDYNFINKQSQAWSYFLRRDSYIDLKFCQNRENTTARVQLTVVKGYRNYQCWKNFLVHSNNLTISRCEGYVESASVGMKCDHNTNYNHLQSFGFTATTDERYYILLSSDTFMFKEDWIFLSMQIHHFGEYHTDTGHLVCDMREHPDKQCTIVLKYRAKQNLIIRAYVTEPYTEPVLLSSHCYPRVSSYIVFFCALPMVAILALVGIIWVMQRCWIANAERRRELVADQGDSSSLSSASSDSTSVAGVSYTPLPTYQEAVSGTNLAAASSPGSGPSHSGEASDQRESPPPYQNLGGSITRITRSRSFS